MKQLLLCIISSFLVSALTAQELPAISKTNKADFFIPASACSKYKLKAGQTDDWMKVYNNLGDDATIQRVNDIRWEAKTKDEATRWFDQNKKMLGEDGKDITDQLSKPTGIDQWIVYGASESMTRMMEAMGIKQKQYNFTFSIDNYVGKIFVAAADNQTLKDAWNFAREGVKATLKAAGKPKLADLIL